jgi:hypothetical protein
MPINEKLVAEIRTKLEQTGYFSSLASFIPCHCSQCFAPPWEEMLWQSDDDLKEYRGENYPKVYTCELCKRQSPYCFGADDEFFEFCDDCSETAFRE